ncbi:MAG: AAA family ATPase [Promethearchaeota archaeon]
MRDLWDSIQEEREHDIFVLLNAPGVGKTVLLRRFGEDLRREKAGLFLNYRCAGVPDTPSGFYRALWDAIAPEVLKYAALIRGFVEEADESTYRDFLLKELDSIQESILAGGPPPSWGDANRGHAITRLLTSLARMIPVYFVVDEVQELQTTTFRVGGSGAETALHHFSGILKGLLGARVLVVLSGTKYHILSQIGQKIGSPVRGKVKSLVISNLGEQDIANFVQEVGRVLSRAGVDLPPEKVSALLGKLEQFLLAFSGGHGRTIELITLVFLELLDTFIAKFEEFTRGNKFNRSLIERVYQQMRDDILSDEFSDAILDCSTRKSFPAIKSWLLTRAHGGYELGALPVNSDDARELAYTLMNVGVILRNGHNNYYLTSYFHLRRTLEVIDAANDTFLRQVLNNTCFQGLCGSHGGFGYVFEDVFAASLLKLKEPNRAGLLPFDPLKLKMVVKVRGRVDWKEFSPIENTLYSFPTQRGIDFLVLQEGKVFVLQVTTERNPSRKKLSTFTSEVEKVKEAGLAGEIHATVISLFEAGFPAELNEGLDLLAGPDVSRILGRDLYEHLVRVKDEL